MLTDIFVCFILYYLFFIREDTPQAAIIAPKPTITEDSDSIDDWEPESDGGITLPCSSPLPPLGLSRPSTPETIIPSTQAMERWNKIKEFFRTLLTRKNKIGG